MPLNLIETGQPSAGPQVHFREAVFSGYKTGALDMFVRGRRIISLPSQLGCRVGCSFCVSKDTPLVRNLSTAQMYELALRCVAEIAPDGRPIELSFTGEGEPLLNWRNTADLVRLLPQLSPDFDAVRYCFSGLGASKLLGRIPTDSYPVRLQFSLHAARQAVRDKLVPNSAPLTEIRAGLAKHGARFSAIELNVVLQDGINDIDEDLEALCAWGDPAWPVLLNPVLGNGAELVGARTDHFEAVLRAAGREVKRYSAIGSKISRGHIYPLMRARPELR